MDREFNSALMRAAYPDLFAAATKRLSRLDEISSDIKLLEVFLHKFAVPSVSYKFFDTLLLIWNSRTKRLQVDDDVNTYTLLGAPSDIRVHVAPALPLFMRAITEKLEIGDETEARVEIPLDFG